MKFINPMEKELTKQFYELEKEAEDIMLDQVNNMVSEYADRICHEKYIKVQEESKKLLDIQDKITDILEFAKSVNELCEQIDVFKNLENDIIEFFGMKSKFRIDIYKSSFECIKENIKQMNGVIYLLEHSNMQRSALNLKFSLKKATQNISYLMIQILDATANTYIDLIINLLIETNEKKEIKKEEIDEMTRVWDKDFKERYKPEETKLVKIVEYEKMVSVLLNLGYKYDHSTGSHNIYINEVTGRSVPVPRHGKDISKVLCFKIQKEIR